MADISEIWEKLLGKTPPSKSERAPLHAAKEKLISALPITLVEGERDATFSREELECLLNTLRSKYTAYLYTMLVRFLARGLRLGTQNLGWQVAIPAIPSKFKREPARFNPLKFKELQRLRNLEKGFLSTFCRNNLTRNHQLGQLLFSAVVYGGLLHPLWVDPWLVALSRISSCGSEIWLEMERIWQPKREASDEGDGKKRKRCGQDRVVFRRRWCPDPLTKALIIRWLRDPGNRNINPVHLANSFDLIRGFLIEAGCFPEDVPVSKRKFVDMAEIRLGLYASSYLVSYAAGKVIAVSVPETTWLRLVTGLNISGSIKREKKVEESAYGDMIGGKGNTRQSSTPAPMYVQQRLLRVYRRIISVNGRSVSASSSASRRKDSAEFMAENGGELAPVIRLLVDWVENAVWKYKKIKLSTARRYVGSISSKLLQVCETEDILGWDKAEFSECYQRVGELTPEQKEKTYAHLTLGRFHAFLVEHHAATPLADTFFWRRRGPEELRVDANLVSQAEFDRVKQAFGWNDLQRSRLASAIILLAIFGYRCGLRHNEARLLRVRDIQGRIKPVLVLRSTPRRSLKSPSATRCLPLHALLPPDELTFMLSWLEQYDGDEGNGLVFGLESNPFVEIPEADLFNPVREAMHLVTGDGTLRFHHLRHSFATWLILRLTGPARGQRHLAMFLDHPEFADDRIAQLRHELMGNEPLGRKGVYAVSALCGHADLGTTLTSYSHLCDWLLSVQLSNVQILPEFDVATMVAVTGLSQSKVYRSLFVRGETSGRPWNWPAYFDQIQEELQPYRSELIANASPPQESRVNLPAVESVWLHLERALRLRFRGRSVDEVSNRLCLPIETIETWYARARQIATMRGRGGGGGRFRHLDREAAGRDGKADIAPQEGGWDQNGWPGHFPSEPLQSVERNLARMLLAAFAQHSTEDRMEVLKLSEFFVHKYSVQIGMVVFWEVEKALWYVSTLRRLGLAARKFVLVDCPGNDPESAEDRRAIWAEQLGLDNPKWSKSGKRYGNPSGLGTIGIRVTVEKGGRNCLSYGFRYALYLIFIMCQGENVQSGGPESKAMVE